MPRQAGLNTGALQRLTEELRFAPRGAIVRDIVRAEALAGELDTETWYPEDWIVFRVTGFRPELEEPASVVGSALLADLSAMVERLSEAAGLDESDASDAIDLDALCARWDLSKKTIARYRRRGLVARRVRSASGSPKLVFVPGVVESFERQNAELVGRAGGFARMTPDVRARVAVVGGRARRRFGWSANETADRLAPRVGRSKEAVRQVLLRGESRDPLRRGPIEPGERRRMHRAWRLGVPMNEIEARWARPRAQIRRAIDTERARALGALDLRAPVGPTFDRDDAGEVLLATEPVRTDLYRSAPPTLVAMLEAMRSTPTPVGVEESSRSIALCYLLYRAARIADGLDQYSPSASSLDQAETALRWAWALEVALVRAQGRVIIETIEGRLGCEIEELGARDAASLVLSAVSAVGVEARRHDPFLGGRMAARATVAANRVAAEWADRTGDAREGRARGMIGDDTPIADWTRLVGVSVDLLLTPGVAAGVPHLDERSQTVLGCRFGLDGSVPMTIDEAAELVGVSRIACVRLERRAIRAARRLAVVG